jgi:hypothetical protein
MTEIHTVTTLQHKRDEIAAAITNYIMRKQLPRGAIEDGGNTRA